MRRDLTELDGDFLATQLADAWQPYLATYHARNASIGRAIFDADDVESELRLLLTEAATRFDHLKGSGNFAAWACDRQRTMLLDVSRKQMGRTVSDAAIAAARGDDIDAGLAGDLRRFHALKYAASLDEPLPSGRLLHDIIADLSTTPRGNTMSTPALHAVDDGKRPHPKKLLDHPDKRIAAAAKKVMDAIDRLDAVWAENAAKAELRAERDRLKAQLKKVEAQLRGGTPTAAPARDWKAIREWAAGSGLDCPATGKVPNAIVDAYTQAHA